jgi:class III poly(R)-hydroxyalkanoic acid synthase PhaE subunit
MTGKSSPDFTDWTALWGDAQQKYWQSWLDLSRQMAGVPKEEPAPNPWAQGFDQWAKLMTGAVPRESQDWASKLTDMNKGYLQMAENLWKMLPVGQAAPQGPDAWREAVTRGLKQMQDNFTAGLSAGKDPWAGFATFWGMPMDNWRRVYSACSSLPGDMEKALRQFSVPGESPETALQRLFSTPTLGYTREWQEEVQQWQQLWLEHGEAARDYGRVLAGITADATERLGKKLYELASQGKAPDTLRAFYDLWVDSGEEAYAEAAMRPEFTQAQTRLVNTLMAMKRQEQKMVDEVLSSLNMPTRRELDTSHRRLHQLQRQVWRLQETLDDAGIRELREEVAALQREVAALRAGTEPAPEKRPAARARTAASKT